MLSPGRFYARTAAVLGLTGGGAWLAGCGAVLLASARLPDVPANGPSRPVLVLGCTPGPAFERRLARAAALHRAGLTRTIVVSGRGEAAWGADYLAAAGVPRGAVRLEPDARNTWENLTHGAALLDGSAFYVVSDRWHLPRALAVARTLGLAAHPVPVTSPAGGTVVFREGLSAVMSVAGGHVPLGAWLRVIRGA